MGVKVREKVKGSGEYWVFISHRGRRKSKKVGGKKLALSVAEKIKARLTLNDFNIDDQEDECPTFKEYATTWLHTYIKSTRRESTYNRYLGILENQVFPIIGTKRVNEISRSDIRDLLLKQHQKGYSRSTIGLVRDVISGPMGYAADEELIPVNPVTGVLKRLKLERENRNENVQAMTPEEVRTFLKSCQSLRPEHYPFFLCAFRTGMRLGELLGLEWGDIDWNSKFILVQRSYKLGQLNKTKTGSSRRVDMSDQLNIALKVILTKAKRDALKSGMDDPFKVVFSRNGKHMEQNYIRRVYKQILKKAGMREMRLHDIRHTFASLLLSNSESPVYVKEQLGHSSIQMTVDIYGHLIPSANRAAVNQLDDSQEKDLDKAINSRLDSNQ